MGKIEFGQGNGGASDESKKSNSRNAEEDYDYDAETSTGGWSNLVKSKKFWGVVAFAVVVIFVMYINYPG